MQGGIVMTGHTRWMLLGVGVALLGCVLGFHQFTSAAPPAAPPPFANSIEQRAEMVEQLKEMNAQLKEQNALLKEQLTLLRSGQVKVIVTLPPEVK
jgi:hypothetical protein